MRWPFLHATRMQPSDRRAKSAHLHTHLHTLLHTHSHTDAGDQRLGFIWFHPPLWLSPPLPPPWLLSAHLHTGNAVPLSTTSPHTALFFLFTIILSRKLWCVAVHRISMLESLWGRGPQEKGIGMGVDDINDFFLCVPNKHPVIMIQFNHPCNICLRHIRGRLPREGSLDWVTSVEI